MSAPEVSVVMSVYNGAQHLEETLRSVFTQEGCDFEIVVVDDGSTDGTSLILSEWGARDKRFRIFPQQNTGLTRALIRGCAEARGVFIARQDAGDVSLPGRLAAQAASLRGNADAVAVSAHTRFVGPKDEALFTKAISEAELNFGLLSGRNGRYYGPAGHGSVMMRRSAYAAVGGYRAPFYFAQDLDLWTRLAERGRFLMLDEVLFQVRLEANAISGIQALEQRRLAELISLATKARRTGGSEAEFLELASKIGPVKGAARATRQAEGNYFIGSCLIRSNPRAAFAYFRSALRDRPTHVRSLAKLAACGWRLCFFGPNR